MNPQWNMLALAHRIQPLASELQSAKLHRAVARTRLEQSFDVSRVLAIGSHSRKTAIRRYSDLDLLVVLRRNEAKWGGSVVSSATVLGRVIDDLAVRFPSTSVRRDKQAAIVSFASGKQGLDVVPALFSKFNRGRPVYLIPNGLGSWFETSPEVHDRYFSQVDEKSGGKLRKTSQLMKWWKHSRTPAIPLSSFHLDMVLASSDICLGIKPYTHCLYQALRQLAARECRGLHDPCGIAGTIYACQTEVQWAALNDVVGSSLAHATSALAAEATKDYEEANRQWSIVFNDEY